MNIFEKMSAITNELGVVAKNLNVDMGKGKSYKAVQEKDILDAVKPLEEKYKVDFDQMKKKNNDLELKIYNLNDKVIKFEKELNKKNERLKELGDEVEELANKLVNMCEKLKELINLDENRNRAYKC